MTHIPGPPEEVSFPTADEFVPERASVKDLLLADLNDREQVELDRLGARAAGVIDSEIERAEEHLDAVDGLVRDRAEAVLAPARAEHERLKAETRQTLLQQTGSLLGGLLVRRQLATTRAELTKTEDTLATRQGQLAEADQNLRRTLEVQVALGARRLMAQFKAGEANKEVADAATALRSVRYAQGWAESKKLVAELQNDDLEKQIADKKAELERLKAEILTTGKLALEGYRWPIDVDDEGNGVLADEKPFTGDDDEPGALIPDAGRIVDRDGTIAIAFAAGTSVKDPEATRVIPKIPNTVIIPTEQR